MGAGFQAAIEDLESNLLHQGYKSFVVKPVGIGPVLEKDKEAEGI